MFLLDTEYLARVSTRYRGRPPNLARVRCAVLFGADLQHVLSRRCLDDCQGRDLARCLVLAVRKTPADRHTGHRRSRGRRRSRHCRRTQDQRKTKMLVNDFVREEGTMRTSMLRCLIATRSSPCAPGVTGVWGRTFSSESS